MTQSKHQFVPQTALQRRLSSVGYDATAPAFSEQGDFVRRRTVLAEQASEVAEVRELRSGWAIARDLSEGKRGPIVRLYLPGDLIGFSEKSCGRHPFQISMIADGSVRHIPQLDSKPTGQRRADRELIWALAQLEQQSFVRTQQHIAAARRLSAADRVKHFLLLLHARLTDIRAAQGERMSFQLKMVDLADIVGLSAVTISQLMGRFKAEGAISLGPKTLTLHHRADWAKDTGYHYLGTSTWCGLEDLPEGTAAE